MLTLLCFQLLCRFEILKRRKDIRSLPICLEVKLPEFGFQLHHYWLKDCRQYTVLPKLHFFNLEDVSKNP